MRKLRTIAAITVGVAYTAFVVADWPAIVGYFLVTWHYLVAGIAGLI